MVVVGEVEGFFLFFIFKSKSPTPFSMLLYIIKLHFPPLSLIHTLFFFSFLFFILVCNAVPFFFSLSFLFLFLIYISYMAILFNGRFSDPLAFGGGGGGKGGGQGKAGKKKGKEKI